MRHQSLKGQVGVKWSWPVHVLDRPHGFAYFESLGVQGLTAGAGALEEEFVSGRLRISTLRGQLEASDEQMCMLLFYHVHSIENVSTLSPPMSCTKVLRATAEVEHPSFQVHALCPEHRHLIFWRRSHGASVDQTPTSRPSLRTYLASRCPSFAECVQTECVTILTGERPALGPRPPSEAAQRQGVHLHPRTLAQSHGNAIGARRFLTRLKSTDIYVALECHRHGFLKP